MNCRLTECLMTFVKLRRQPRAYSSPPQYTTPTKFSRNVSITYTLASITKIHVLFMDLFRTNFYFFSVPLPGSPSPFAGSPDSLVQFSILSAHQFSSHASRITHCGLEIYGLMLVFPIHKHSISLQLFRGPQLLFGRSILPSQSASEYSSHPCSLERASCAAGILGP